MFGVTYEAWNKEQTIIFSNSDEKEFILCGDGRCDSPGHNAKYLTYFLYDQIQIKVVAISLTQVTEVGSSNRKEKTGLVKTLQAVTGKEHKIERLTTGRHLQIKKYMREQEEDINHQFGVWHFSKSIKTKSLNVSKKKTCEELKLWIKSICNHFWWACTTCENDEVLLKEKWTSVIFHIQNKHTWTGNTLYHQSL